MAKFNLFTQPDYKSAIRERIDELKLIDRMYSFQNLAAHCRVQKTYLSKVLRDPKAHLNEDHLYLAAEFLRFTPEQKVFFRALHDFGRTLVPARRKELARLLESLRQKSLKTERHIHAETVRTTPEVWSHYFLDTDAQLCHSFLGISDYGKDLRKLRERLGVTSERLHELLGILEKCALIEITGGEVKVLSEELHLPDESPVMRPYQVGRRVRALEKIRSYDPKRDYLFSVIYSATPAVQKRIRERFLEFLGQIHPEVRDARSERVYQMNFDLVEW